MKSETEQSLKRVAVFAALHSRRYALSGYSLGELTEEQILDIANLLVRRFENLFEERRSQKSVSVKTITAKT